MRTGCPSGSWTMRTLSGLPETPEAASPVTSSAPSGMADLRPKTSSCPKALKKVGFRPDEPLCRTLSRWFSSIPLGAPLIRSWSLAISFLISLTCSGIWGMDSNACKKYRSNGVTYSLVHRRAKPQISTNSRNSIIRFENAKSRLFVAESKIINQIQTQCLRPWIMVNS